jgi:hypothetical protein
MGVLMAIAPKIRTVLLLLAGCGALSNSGYAQAAAVDSPGTASADRPLPEIVAMMQDVEANQRKAEKIEKDYIYRSVETREEVNGSGQIKKTTVQEYDHYWIDGVPVRRLVKKDGKALSADEIAKEDERNDQEAAQAREKRDKADHQGKASDPRGDEEITVSRLLELGAFTNPRRAQFNGRDTIAVDYAGDPKAKTRNRAEEVIRDLAGTVWVDEQDHVLVRVEGHFLSAFKVGGGLIASVQKDTRFSMVQTKVNGEVWLPERLEGQGAFHALLFFGFSGRGEVVNSDYRKFRATSTILPGTPPSPAPPVP